MSLTLRELKESLGPNPSPRTREQFNALALDLDQQKDAVVRLEGGGLLGDLAKKAKTHVTETAKTIGNHVKKQAKGVGKSLVDSAKAAGHEAVAQAKATLQEAGEKAVAHAKNTLQEAGEKAVTKVQSVVVGQSPKPDSDEAKAKKKPSSSGGCVIC